MSSRNTTTCIIQARIGSTRLPGKVMYELAGKPMLWHIVERVRASRRIDRVVVATTSNSEDLSIELFCKAHDIPCVRGSVNDVLDRYYQAAQRFPADIIVRIPADKPLIDPALIDRCIEELERGGYDYVSNVHPPGTEDERFLQGIAVEAFRFAALEQAHRYAKEQHEKEHVTPYLWENKTGEFKILKIDTPEVYRRNHRLTVDYPEDLELVEKIYRTFYRPGKVISITEVLSFLDNHPELAVLNAHCEQKPAIAG